MAKPIRATPQLSGKEAEIFVKKMIAKENERITPRDVAKFEAIQNAVPLAC